MIGMGTIGLVAFLICVGVTIYDTKEREKLKEKKKRFDERYMKGLETEYPDWYK